MKFKASGDSKRMEEWAGALGSANQLLEAMSRNLAEESVGLIKDGFRAQADPYGKPWQPKKYDDGRAILTGRTGNLRTGWHVTKSTRGGFTVAPSVRYAVHHQFGAPRAKIPKRMMVPGKGRLPQAWRDAFNESTQELLAAHFGGTTRPSAKGASFITAKIGGLKRRFNAAALLRKVMKKVSGE
jgi:phage gpG-like protein